MSGMEIAGLALSGIGTIVQASSAMAAGDAAKKAQDYQAAQLRQQAGQEQAAAQRAVIDQNRKTAVVASRAQALAAASGGGASDETVVKDISDIAGEGSFRAQTAMYEGDAKAQNLNNSADAHQLQGRIDQQAGQTKAFSSIISSGSSLFQKYGSPSPTSSSTYDFGPGWYPGMDNAGTAGVNWS